MVQAKQNMMMNAQAKNQLVHNRPAAKATTMRQPGNMNMPR